MNSTPKIALSVLALAISSTAAWSQPTEDDLNPQNRNPVGTQAGSQLDSSTAMSLEQLAMRKPAELEGKAVTGNDGERIGEIEELVVRQNDQDTYALINTTQDDQAAVKLSELEIEALAVAESAGSMPGEEYQSSEYERFSQTRTDPQGNAAANVQADLSAEVQDAVDRVARGAGIGDEMDESLVEQLAMSSPEDLEGKKLISESGEELGEIDHVARSRSDDQLVAVVNSNSDATMSVIPLASLQIAEVRYDGDIDDLEDESFRADEFEVISSPG